MAVNVYPVATAQRIAKWELMCDGMHKEARTLRGLPVWVAAFVQQFAPEVC